MLNGVQLCLQSANGPQGDPFGNRAAHSGLPIQSQPPVFDLHTDTRIEAKILDLLNRDSSRTDTGGLAVSSAYDIP